MISHLGLANAKRQIADIMAIAPRMVDGSPILKVAISEAKFVSSRGYRTQAKKSAKQLEKTVARLGRAIDPKHKRIDREIWLHRLGDFMIEGMEPFDPSLMNGWDLHQWSDEVRQDKIPIQLAGFSHVFVHDNEESVDAGGDTPLKGMPHCTQQVLDKTTVARYFRSFAQKSFASGERTTSESKEWTDAPVSSKSTADGLLRDIQTISDSGTQVTKTSHHASNNSIDIPKVAEEKPPAYSALNNKTPPQPELTTETTYKYNDG